MITRVVGSILSGMPHVPEDRPHRGSPARQFSGATAGHEAQTFQVFPEHLGHSRIIVGDQKLLVHLIALTASVRVAPEPRRIAGFLCNRPSRLGTKPGPN